MANKETVRRERPAGKNPLKLMHRVLSGRPRKQYAPKIPLYLERKNYIIKTADNLQELHSALRLRHSVFIEELLKKKKRSGLDTDQFDKRCDHLLIIDRRDGKLIGTYRLQSSLHTRRWYTATEFHMKHIRKLPGNKLELGRACVHPDYRNGVTIALLWEGIRAYTQASGTRYLFGCSSIKTMNRDEIRQIYHYLQQQDHLTEEHKVRPKGRFRVQGLKRQLKKYPLHQSGTELSEILDMMPPLLRAYLKAGAKVCGNPALDKNFRCIDFLTLLDVAEIGRRFAGKFDLHASTPQG